MKMMVFLVLTILVIGSLSTVASAQSAGCTDTLIEVPYACQGPNHCSQSGTTQVPGGGYGYAVRNLPQMCCGVASIPYYIPYGLCYISELRTPKMQGRLLALARSSDLLVADCQGRYVPYQPNSEHHKSAIVLRDPPIWKSHQD